jgi:hypothetical protein
MGGMPGGGATSSGGATPGSGGSKPVGYSLDCPAPVTGSPALRLFTRLELENTINDLFPGIKGQWTNSLPAGSVKESGFDNEAGTVPGNQFVAALTETAESIASALVGGGFATLLPCSAAAADRACAGTFVDQHGRRLFRRPLTQAEKDRYLTLFDSLRAATDFKASIKWIATGLIQSPNAVFRSEIGALANGTRTLSPHEVATELAYTFTLSTPSDELLTKADSGALGDPVAIAKALLQTEGGKRAVQRFFEGYLGYTKVSSITKPNVTSPAFSALGPEMVLETRAFIDDVVFQKKGGLKELLTASTSNPSKTLATFYGFPAPANDYAATARPAGRGIGVLAQGAFLASHANSDASSPTQRGLFPFYRLLCKGQLHAPADVPTIGSAAVTKTTRERYEVAHLTRGGACVGCHRQFDPIGFGFEHYDEAGRYRDMQNGEPINAAAAILGPDGTTPLFSFTSQEELVTGLANQAVAYQCFTAYLATYAFGSTESCLGPTQAAALQAGTIGIVDALAGLAAEPHFTKRKAQ